MAFGLIPEFVGRLPVVATVEDLDKESLIRVLVEPKNALIKQYAKFFEMDGVELVFTDDALVAVADQALLRGTGARGLRAILEEVLLNTMYELPSRPDIARVVIDGDVVRERVNPTLIPMQDIGKSLPQGAQRLGAPSPVARRPSPATRCPLSGRVAPVRGLLALPVTGAWRLWSDGRLASRASCSLRVATPGVGPSPRVTVRSTGLPALHSFPP